MNVELAWTSLPLLLKGTGITLALVSQALVYGMAIALPIALARLSKNPFLWIPAYAYILFFRGTPLLVQLFLIYFGLGQFAFIRESIAWLVLREAWWCAIISLTLSTAGYTAEIFRGAILGVSQGDIDAARALGMSRFLCFRRIVLPKAFRLALAAYGNEVIFLLKGSALVSTITIVDLTGAANFIYYRTYDPFTPFIAAGAIYLLMVLAITRIFQRIEFSLTADLRLRSAKSAFFRAKEPVAR